MTTTFGRKIEVSFRHKATNASIAPSGELNIGFTAERTLDLEPSTCLATIHNLSKDTQEAFKDTQRAPQDAHSGWEVSLSAGYGESAGAIFVGDVRFIRHRREPPTLATDVEADDGGEAATKYVTRHFSKGVTVGKVFQWLQEQSGLGAGNVTRIQNFIKPDGLPDRLKNGVTVKGYAMEEMGDLAKSRGYVISSQNNELLVLEPGEALPGADTVKISADTGLIGYPYVDNEGILTLNHRLHPGVTPGAKIDVSSDFVTGTYVVERAVYSGSLWDSDFNVEVEGRATA